MEFLVQLSHKTIKKVKHPPKESKESKEPEESKPIKLHPPQIKNAMYVEYFPIISFVRDFNEIIENLN